MSQNDMQPVRDDNTYQTQEYTVSHIVHHISKFQLTNMLYTGFPKRSITFNHGLQRLYTYVLVRSNEVDCERWAHDI